MCRSTAVVFFIVYTIGMLSLFPQILFLAPLSATILRIAAALVFAYVAWRQIAQRETIAQTRSPVVGSGMWIVWFSTLSEGVVALGLFLGLFTQLCALVGFIIALKYIVWGRRYPAEFPLTRTASLLLAAVTLSLVFTGAGAFAFDLPL